MVTRPQETDQPTDPFKSNVEPVGAGETGFSVSTGSAMGGVDPNYKMPTSYGTPDNPYTFTTSDINIIYKVSTDKLASYNQQLMKAFPGYKPSSLTNRSDAKLRSYFGKALTQINILNSDPNGPLRGKTLDQALSYLAENPVFEASTKLPTYRLTNPDDLKKVFEKASQSTIGRTLSDTEISNLVKAYQQQEKTYQQQIAKGGTITEPMQAETFAQKRIEKRFGVEAQATDYQTYIGALSELLGG